MNHKILWSDFWRGALRGIGGMAFADKKSHSGEIHKLFQNAAERYGKINID
jgi:hypothetical protein